MQKYLIYIFLLSLLFFFCIITIVLSFFLFCKYSKNYFFDLITLFINFINFFIILCLINSTSVFVYCKSRFEGIYLIFFYLMKKKNFDIFLVDNNVDISINKFFLSIIQVLIKEIIKILIVKN